MTATESRGLLDEPVARLHGIRRDAVPLLERKGVRTIRDLIWYLPRDYHDFADTRPIAELLVNKDQTAEGVLANVRHVRTLRGRGRTEAELVDRTGRLRLVWFGRERTDLVNGRRVRVAGTVGIFRGMRQMTQPAVERVGTEAVHTGRIAPIYKLTEGLSEG